MAVEKNPYDMLKSNVIPMDIGIEEESSASIEVDDDGGVTVDFGMEDLMGQFPNAKTFPQIVVDDKSIGGYTEFAELVND